MDQRERLHDPDENMRAILDARQFEMWTAMPAIVDSYDAVEGTVACTIALLERVQQTTRDATSGKVDTAVRDIQITQLIHCPVVFPQGGGGVLTMPIAKGDEVLVVFASRCIDAWWQLGKATTDPNVIAQPQVEFRMHDLSDGFVIPGPRSQARRITGVSTTTVQLRSVDGTTFVELDPTGQIVNITAPGGVTINGVHIAGDGTVTGPKEATFNGHSVGGHVHTDPQGGVVGAPTG